jgi:ComF family protein
MNIQILHDFINLIFPNLCLTCGNSLLRQEEYICTPCLYKLPRTNFHFERDNPVCQLFWGRVNIEAATSYFFFSKGSIYQKLIHQLKYNGQKEVGEMLGEHFGIDIIKSELFKNIDAIIPVPLHPKKQKARGYNQSEWIAKGLAKSMKIQIDNESVIRHIYSDTQTKKNRSERWENVKSIFRIQPKHNLSNKHILLIDDVLTTGATLEACAQTILENCNTKVSIATLAFAKH